MHDIVARSRRHVPAVLLAAVLWLAAAVATAQTPPAPGGVDLHFFWRIGCPHCEREAAFLARLSASQPGVRIHRYEVSRERANAALMLRVADALSAEAGSVPLTVVGGRAWVGFHDDASTGAEIAAQLARCLARPCADLVARIRAGAPVVPAPRAVRAPPETLHLPLFGEVRLATLSLPVLTVVLAAADGFNPCAMWVLVFLLGLLAGMRDRSRMWVLGGAFVAASAFTYLLVLGAWLNVLLFVGSIVWVRLGVALVALGAGGWYLRNFFSSAAMECEVTAPEARRRVLERLRSLAQQRDFLVALGGIVLLAFAVNVVEFLCSAGIPAVFTQVLALSELAPWQYAGYLLLYVFVFMLDDMAVLVVALKTLEVTGLTTAYARWSNLAGGVVLVLIGVLLLARPEWLSYG